MVSANPITIYTDEQLPSLTYTVLPAGVENQLEGQLETTYSNGLGPGEYPISQGGLRLKREALSTYSLKFVPSTVTVKEKPAQPKPQVTATNWVDGAKDCNTRKVTQSRTVTATPYRWDSSARKWVLDASKASKKAESRQRDMNDGEHRACTPQPPAQVTSTAWVDGAKDCNTRKVSQSRTVTTTPHKWDSGKRQWVLDTSKASKKTETRQRDMNDGEHRACSPQPPAQVTATNWVDGAKDCNTRKVSQSRTVTTTPYKWDSGKRKWVLDTAKASKKTETRQRDMNDGEHRECTPQPPAQVTATNWADGAKDCNTRKVSQSRTVTTTPYKWDSGKRQWVLDTAKASKKSETRQRDMNDGEHRACTPQPNPQVTAANWVDGAKDCNTRKVTQSRTVTTTPYKWDSGKRQWVLDTAKVSKKTESRQRDMNDGEHRACTPQPPAQVTATDWVDGAKDCNARKVSQSRTVTTTPYKWDSGSRKWVLDTSKASKKTESRQRDMNDGEHRQCTPQPSAQVTSTDWVDGAKDCNTRKVSQSRTVTTTPHRWDSGKRQWVLDTAKASKKTETRQREMNDGEHRACTPQPNPQVTATNWVDGAKDCNTRKVSQSRTVTTTPHKWDSSQRKWVPDTGKAVKRTETRQRDMNDGEHKACSPQPPAQVTATNWVDGAKDCNTRKVTQSRTVTTTPSKWDSFQRKWVLDSAASSTKTETRQREMNDDEHQACTPRIPVQVTHSDWVDGSKDCNTRKVTQSRTVTTTPSKWDSSQRKWVLDTAASSTKTETRERDMNDAEHQACTPRLPVQVTHSDWVDGSKDCNTRKVTQSRTVTTTPPKWDSGKRQWVLDTAKASKKTETRERDMDERELGECVNVALTVSKDTLTVVKGQPVLEPLSVEATSTTDAGLISLQTVCAPKHDGQADTDQNALPVGVELVRVKQASDGVELAGNGARTVGEVDGNATQAELGTYRCWVYATKPGITIDPLTGAANGPNAVEGVGWARKPLSVEVVQPALPKTGGAGMNRTAGLGALLIVGVTGGWWWAQTRRKKGVGRRA
ncbi:hypothetical protein QP112_06380 [Actinotignum timonense]|uniref:hypothetical protein n=1 Tax=Actinotignum timonense TaxID=1870995 RepID=UPI00254A1147|nr:hypothetical protein [Actinotignum timonense]MDK6373705.1 hypothetical protein [Actinotignum timonense]MDK8356920.1 hypothetical protein [Actinotignum timonense]